jgi:hypothetical protein
MPPMQAGAPGGAPQPAKTMFGYAAPQVPRPGTGPAQPGQGFAPPQQQGFGQQPGARPGQTNQPGFGQQPAGYPPGQPQQPGYPPQPGQPPQQANPYGQPPQPGGFGGQPPNPYGQPQQPPNPYGQPQQPGGFGGQPQQPPNPYGQPQQPPNPYGQPPPPQGFGGQPPQQNPYGQPPPSNPGYAAGATPGFGQPQQGFGQAPPQYPQGGGYPQAGGFGAAPQQDLPGPLDDLARKVPGSAPGTIFGFPVARLRDPSIQRKVLFMAGVALLVSIVIPISLSPTIFPFSGASWDGLIWPIIAGGGYLLVAAAPPDIRAKVPPAVLQWIPFGISFAGIFMVGGGGGGGFMAFATGSGLYMLGYAVLVFGLLARIAQPQDQIARIVIAVGAGMLVPDFIDILRFAFRFSYHGGAIFTVLMLLTFVVTLMGIACALFVVPPQKLPPALQAVDALGPLFTAVLILWLPLKIVLLGLGLLVHASAGISAILIMAHLLIRIVAFFGVLMLVAPAAYEEVMRLVKGGGGGGSAQPPGGYPPPGGGYPPQGGGYPPQGGGYPPQGGGYPPQQGGGGGWQ